MMNRNHEGSDENDLIIDIASNFSGVEKIFKTGPSIGKKLTNNIKNVMLCLTQGKTGSKIRKHARHENLNYLKFKKCNPEIWSEMLLSKTKSKYLKTQKMQGAQLI